MSQKIRLRAASLSDLELLRYWDTKPHVIASDPNDYWGWEEDLSKPQPFWREQLIAMLYEEPIGFIQIIDPFHEETHYWGEVDEHLRAIDIWIGEEQHLGKGYGTQMMHIALKKCFASPEVMAVIIDPLTSNQRAIRFYERIGFRYIETKFFGTDECYVMRLDRNDFDYLWSDLFKE